MSEADLGIYMLIAIIAMAISMAIIPLMIRIAPAIGMIDKPDHRKIHITPIPRVGGVGIVIGLLLPLLIWLPMNAFIMSFLPAAQLLVAASEDKWLDVGGGRAALVFISRISLRWLP